jgi:hypothetical protein
MPYVKAANDVIVTRCLQASQVAWLSWLVMAVIGIAVGLAAWVMQLVRAGPHASCSYC